MLVLILVLVSAALGSSVVFQNGAYENIVVRITDDVPSESCRILLNNLESALTASSKSLHTALDGRVYFGNFEVILPEHWPDSCAKGSVMASEGQSQDIILGRSHPTHKNSVWTQQSGQCGESGDFIYIPDQLLLSQQNIGKELTREWAKFRYGVFDEIGYKYDQIYPQCYHGTGREQQVTGCSDKEIVNVCDSEDETSEARETNVTKLVSPLATRSLLFAPNGENIDRFCDEKTHDFFAPTKQNLICGRKSAMEVINRHRDFSESAYPTPTPPSPEFRYTRRTLTRYILILENTKDMVIRESWSFLRAAIRKWTVHDLPSNTELGFILISDTSAQNIHDLTPLNSLQARDRLASDVPFSPADNRGNGCISCGLRQAIEMLEERRNGYGPASSVILLIAPGLDRHSATIDLEERARINHIRIASITYPAVLRAHPLDIISSNTGAISFTVNEQKYNQLTSLLSTYFDLSNALYTITTAYFQGNPTQLPIEIHRKELIDDGRTSVTGSFVLEEYLGEPAEFVIYTHSIENPLLKSVQLVSPSQKIYTGRSDSLLQFKLMRILTNINETGTWSYTVERFTGNPQPHFVQVMASPRSTTAPVVRAKAWTNHHNSDLIKVHRNRREIVENEAETETTDLPTTTNFLGRSFDAGASYQQLQIAQNSSLHSRYKVTVEDLRKSKIPRRIATKPVIIYAEIKYGLWPVIDARVEVVIRKRDANDTNQFKERLQLLDTGSGDPDIMKYDGIYSRYWSPVASGPGAYSIDITVFDNGNTAYSWADGFALPKTDEPCCGSVQKPPSIKTLSPFQRHLPRLTLSFTQEDIDEIQAANIGRVLDLKVENIAESKARLRWTAPDMGGLDVARYTLHYSPTLEPLLSQTSQTAVWPVGNIFPLQAGIDTTFTLDFKQRETQKLLDQELFFGLVAYPFNLSTKPGPVSNYVRVYVPSPPPPPPPDSTSGSVGFVTHESSEPSMDKPRFLYSELRLELIIPVIAGILLLALCLAVYCYFCIVRRRHAANDKGKHTPKGSPEKAQNINIISTQGNLENRTNSASSTTSSNTSHSTLQHDLQNNGEQYEQYNERGHYGYVEDPARRYSAMQTPEEAYIIAQARHISQQQQHQQPPSYVVSEISDGTTGRIRTLSPFQSWTASQLLQEHEARRFVSQEGDTNRHLGPQFQLPPPVPPLPNESLYSDSGLRTSVSGIHPHYRVNPSLQGSLSSVHSGDVRKKRNVTMV